MYRLAKSCLCNLRNLWPLSPRERSALALALIVLPLTAGALRILRFTLLQSIAARIRDPRTIGPEVDGRAREIARMVAAAAVHGVFRPTCLPRSLVLQWMLGRHGIASDLRFGIRKERDRFEAHCWVEHGGKALIEEAFEPKLSYMELASRPNSMRRAG